jgi:thermitase
MENGISKSGRSVLGFLLVGALFLVGFLNQGVTESKILTQPLSEHVPGEVLVKVHNSLLQVDHLSVLTSNVQNKFGTNSVLGVHQLKTNKKLFKLSLKKDQSISSVIKHLKTDPTIDKVEPNYIYHKLGSRDSVGMALKRVPAQAMPPQTVPNDPDFSKLWGIFNTGQADPDGQVGIAGNDVGVVPVWQEGHTGSKEVVVAVIDTGVSWDHPDLVDNLYTNPGEAGNLATNGKDDDGNGFIDDVHGWNFEANTNASDDDHSHGTHCAGIVPIKFLSSQGYGTLEGAVEGINYAASLGVHIMSNSWGGGGASDILEDSIKAARDKGILFVAAAGNESNDNDVTPMYPASYDVENIVSVAAIDNKGQLASFSNYGLTTVHVAAPGVKVLSTVKDKGYAVYSGTSMATPHVSGVAALLLSIHPEWDFKELKNRIMNTSEPIQSLRRKIVSRGRVNTYNALTGTIPSNPDPDETKWVDVAQTLESVHPYDDNQVYEFKVHVPNAEYVRISFEKIATEARYDKVTVETPSGRVVEELSGTLENYMSDYIMGDTAIVKLTSDYSISNWGFKIGKVQMIPKSSD